MKIRYPDAAQWLQIFLERTIPEFWWNIKSSVVAQGEGSKGWVMQQHPSMNDGRQIYNNVLCSFSTSVLNKVVIQILLRSKNNACL